MRKRVLTVLGTRPEAVKLAPVIRALRAMPEQFESVLCCTGQHVHLVKQAMDSLDISPDVSLDSMVSGQSLGQLTSRLFSMVDRVLDDIRPDLVLVQGDTTTALVGATCAFYQRIALGHVEAGLRTGDRYSPFPEEINRVMIGHIANVHFAPTARAASNLLSEGADVNRVHVTGNTVVDALNWIRPRVSQRAHQEVIDLVRQVDTGARIILVTCHRRESISSGIAQICRALSEIVQALSDVAIIFVTHLNPEVRALVVRELPQDGRVLLVEPVDYFSLLYLIERSALILTDSGGIQEEAPSFGKPVLVLRDHTERPEAVEAGCAMIVGTNPARIVEVTLRLLARPAEYAQMVAKENPFGDGAASTRIAHILSEDL